MKIENGIVDLDLLFTQILFLVVVLLLLLLLLLLVVVVIAVAVLVGLLLLLAWCHLGHALMLYASVGRPDNMSYC